MSNRQWKKILILTILIILTIILSLLLTPTPTTTLMYQNHWEDGIEKPSTITFEADCHTKSTSGYESFFLSDKYARNGEHSLRNEMHGTWKNDDCPAGSDNTFEAKSRQELIHGKGIDGLLLAPGSKTSQGDERWIGGSFYYPSNEGTFDSWWSDTSNCTAIMQLFGSGNSGTPELFMSLCGNGKVKLENRVSTNQYEEEIVMYTATGEFRPDHWNDVIIHWLRDYDDDGILEVWFDGKKIMSRVNTPVSIRDKPDGSIKSGMYFGEEIRDEVYVQYQDAWRIGNEDSSYSAVDPAQGTEPEPEPEPPANEPKLVAVNGGYPLSPNQVISIEAQHSTAIVGCLLNDADERTVNWNYSNNRQGQFSTTTLPTSSATYTDLKCFYEPFVSVIPLDPLQWKVRQGSLAPWEGERFGYLSGLTLSINGEEGAMQYEVPATILSGKAGDRVRVDVTYSVPNGEQVRIDWGAISAVGEPGNLQLQNSQQASSAEVLNRSFGEGLYRVAIFFTETATEQQTYSMGIGLIAQDDLICQQITAYEVVLRKNWTTKTVETTVPLSQRP